LEALLLARPGIYGLIIYNAEESTDEIGIHVALGASYGSLLRIKLKVPNGIEHSWSGIGNVTRK
jgi:hypothetical protein